MSTPELLSTLQAAVDAGILTSAEAEAVATLPAGPRNEAAAGLALLLALPVAVSAELVADRADAWAEEVTG